MIAFAKPFVAPIQLVTFRLPRLFAARRRRQATIDLVHSSPHLLRDIGATEGRLVDRRR